MKLLKIGSRGPEVVDWQEFLVGRGYKITADGDFGRRTHRATRGFQDWYGLDVDGLVGNDTITAAMGCGWSLVSTEAWPPEPTDLSPYVGNAARARRFGKFEYVAAPTPRNREAIKILGNWRRENIVRVRVDGVPGNKGVWLHKDVAESFRDLWEAWYAANLLRHVVTWNGSYVPRFVRGSTRSLSNHAWGTAFDINAMYNRIRHVPSQRGDRGSVRELVESANAHGWYWGGHFTRKDGMHFEYGKRRR